MWRSNSTELTWDLYLNLGGVRVGAPTVAVVATVVVGHFIRADTPTASNEIVRDNRRWETTRAGQRQDAEESRRHAVRGGENGVTCADRRRGRPIWMKLVISKNRNVLGLLTR